MNAMRSSIPNSVFSLRTERLTTATTTSSYSCRGAADHIEVAVGDRVIGARTHGYRLVGAHHSRLGSASLGPDWLWIVIDGVAVAPLLCTDLQRQLERRAPIALDDDARRGRQQRRQASRKPPSKLACLSVWRIDEHQIVRFAALACGAQGRERVRAPAPRARGARSSKACEIRPQRCKAPHDRARRTTPLTAPLESASIPSAPCRRTGRARRALDARRASRTAPRARDLRSAVCARRRAERSAVARRRRPRSPSCRDRLQRLGAEAPAPALLPSRRARDRSSSGSSARIAFARARARSSSSASSGRLAKRNWPMPDWRVPSSSPSLRMRRSISASAKPIGVLDQRTQPSRAWRADQQTRASGARRDRPARATGAAGRSRSARRSRPASRSRWERPRRPRSRSWPPAPRPARRRTPPSPACFSRGRICPCSSASRRPASSPPRRRSNSAVAARCLADALGGAGIAAPRSAGACRSASSLLDQRAHHIAPGDLRPAARAATRRPRARPLSPATMRVSIGLRPRGSSRSTLRSRSPWRASASVRGIGVAVMCSVCGCVPRRRRLATACPVATSSAAR